MGEENKENTEKANYDILREQITLLAKEFRACDGFLSKIESIKDKHSFAKFYEDTFSTVADKFGFEPTDDDDEDLEEQVSDLEDQVSDLETELEELKDSYPKVETLWDEQKARHFRDYREQYTEWELEELLKNGKKLLALNNNLNQIKL